MGAVEVVMNSLNISLITTGLPPVNGHDDMLNSTVVSVLTKLTIDDGSTIV